MASVTPAASIAQPRTVPIDCEQGGKSRPIEQVARSALSAAYESGSESGSVGSDLRRANRRGGSQHSYLMTPGVSGSWPHGGNVRGRTGDPSRHDSRSRSEEPTKRERLHDMRKAKSTGEFRDAACSPRPPGKLEEDRLDDSQTDLDSLFSSTNVAEAVLDRSGEAEQTGEPAEGISRMSIMICRDGATLIPKWWIAKKSLRNAAKWGVGGACAGGVLGVIAGVVASVLGLKFGGKVISRSILVAGGGGTGLGVGAAIGGAYGGKKRDNKVYSLKVVARKFAEDFPKEHVKEICKAFFYHHFTSQEIPEESRCGLSGEFITMPVAIEGCECEKMFYERRNIVAYYRRSVTEGGKEGDLRAKVRAPCGCKKFSLNELAIFVEPLEKIHEVVTKVLEILAAQISSVSPIEADLSNGISGEISPELQNARIEEIKTDGRLNEAEIRALKLYLRSGFDSFSELIAKIHSDAQDSLFNLKRENKLSPDGLSSEVGFLDSWKRSFNSLRLPDDSSLI